MTKLYFIPLFILCLVIIFISTLNVRPLSTPDEGRYANIGLTMNLQHDYITPRVNGLPFLDKPPLFFWVESMSVKLFGVHIWSFRIVPALFAILGCLFTFWFASKCYGLKTGMISCLILASNPLYICAANYVNVDMAVAVLIAASLIFFRVGIGELNTASEKPKPGLLYLAYIFAALATLTKGLIGIVFPMMVIGLWILITHRWYIIKKMRIISGLCLYFALTLPWFILVSLHNPGFLHYFFIYEQFQRFSSQGFNNQMPWFFYIAILLIGFFPWSVVLYPSIKFQLKQYKQHLFVIIWFLSILIFFSIPSSKIVSYILPTTFPFAILFALFINHNIEDQKSKLHWSFYIIPLITLIGSLVGLVFIKISRDPIFELHNTMLVCLLLACAFSGFIFVYCYQHLSKFKAIIITALLNVSIILTGIVISPKFLQHNNYFLAKKIENIVKPDNQLILYHDYLFDLPVYLKRNVMIANNWQAYTTTDDNWQGHFKQSIQQTIGKQLLVNDNQFLALWYSALHYYLLINTYQYHKNLALFKANKIVLKTPGWLLLKNFY